MTIRYLITLISLFSICCKEKQPKNKTQIIGAEKGIKERLENYFDSYEVTPAIIFNNYDNRQLQVSFLNHKIKLLENEEENETKIKIDNDWISLKKELTVNEVQGGQKDEINFANYWDQIRYYNCNIQELIVVKLESYPCTGKGCGVNYFLIYDLHHKTKTFFGTYDRDINVGIYKFNNDNGQLDFISTTNRGTSIDYKLYSLNEKGYFTLQKDEQGKPYFLTHNLKNEETGEKETLIENWFEHIK